MYPPSDSNIPAFWLSIPAWYTRLLTARTCLIYQPSDCRYRPDIPASWLPVPAWYTGLLTASTCLIESPSDCLYRPDIPAFWLWYTRLLTAYAGLPKWWNYCVIPCLDLPSKPVHKFKPVWFRLQSLYKIPAYLNLPSRRPVHKFLPTWIWWQDLHVSRLFWLLYLSCFADCVCCEDVDGTSFFVLFLRYILVCRNYLYSCLTYWVLLCLSSGTDL